MTKKSVLSVLLLVLAFSYSYSQEPLPARPSPLAIAACKYKDTYVKIVYGQPHKRGREVFGELVPFNKVWRTGANEATEITFTKDVFINGQLFNAGTYSVFTIPTADRWTIILNKELGLWGSYNYNDKMDALRFDVPVQHVEPPTVYEPFTIEILQRNNKADVVLTWDRTRVSFPIDFIEPKQ